MRTTEVTEPRITARSAGKISRGGKGGAGSSREEKEHRRQRSGLHNNPFGDEWLEHLFCRQYVEATTGLRTDPQRTREAPRGSVNVEALEEDAKALLHCREDCTAEVNTWVTEVAIQCSGRISAIIIIIVSPLLCMVVDCVVGVVWVWPSWVASGWVKVGISFDFPSHETARPLLCHLAKSHL